MTATETTQKRQIRLRIAMTMMSTTTSTMKADYCEWVGSGAAGSADTSGVRVATVSISLRV